jgi:AmmeMemoRadiSam system protein A
VNPKDVLSEPDQRALLALARAAVRHGLDVGRRPPPPDIVSPPLREKRGVFVTLQQEGALRGCIGFPFPVLPLGRACPEAAYSAAFEDPRFPPVTAGEWEALSFEVSALTPPAPLRPDQVRVGIHGLIVKRGPKSGLLLPQVAVEYRWEPEEFIRQTCRKAGLPPDAVGQGAELTAFEAQVFSDEDLGRRNR